MNAESPPRETVPYGATIRMFLIQWSRSRAPYGLVAFVATLCWYDHVSNRDPHDPWTLLTSVIALSGFLIAYDTYERLRADTSLRLILLHGERRITLAAGFASAAMLLGFVATGMTLAYLVIAGRIDSTGTFARALPISLIALAGWVIYAQLLSLLLPRDTAAVLGVILLVFGSRSPAAWMPPGMPVLVERFVTVLWSVIPTGVRSADILNGRHVALNISVQILQITCALAAVTLVLSRRELIARQRGDA